MSLTRLVSRMEAMTEVQFLAYLLQHEKDGYARAQDCAWAAFDSFFQCRPHLVYQNATLAVMNVWLAFKFKLLVWRAEARVKAKRGVNGVR
jgi:hypothetical protein